MDEDLQRIIDRIDLHLEDSIMLVGEKEKIYCPCCKLLSDIKNHLEERERDKNE